MTDSVARTIAQKMGFSSKAVEKAAKQLQGLYKLFIEVPTRAPTASGS
jgi:succinyl-CoA synthetase beta subunit